MGNALKTKKLLGSVLLIVGFGVALFLLKPQPQTITLPDGTQLTLKKVTCGKRPSFQGWSGNFDKNDNTNDTLNIWIQRHYPPGQHPEYQFMLIGESGYYSVESRWNMVRSIQAGEDTQFISFGSFPRRGDKLQLQVRQWSDSPTVEWATNQDYWKKTVKGEFIVPNLTRGSFPTWQPQPLPVTQRDGDLEVTMTKLIFGVSDHRGGEMSTSDPGDRAVFAVFRIKQNGSFVTNWLPAQIDSWDATGNHTVNTSWASYLRGDDAVMRYQWGLPPDEPAWKLRAEFSRTSGFSDDELLTFTNVPIVTNKFFHVDQSADITDAFVKKDFAGTTVYVFSVRQSEDPDDHGKEQLRFQMKPTPEGLRLKLLKVTDEHGGEISSFPRSWGGGGYNYGLTNPGDAKTVNVTLALHRSRYAEFIVKPEKQ